MSEPLSPVFSYAELNAVGKAMGEHMDCSVLATCIVTGETYTKIHELYRKLGRRNGCRTGTHLTWMLLRDLGYQPHDVTHFYDGCSIRSLAPQLPSKGNFLVFVRGHVAAVRDGVLEDEPYPKKNYVKKVFQILPMEDVFFPPAPRKRKVVVDYEKPTKAVWAIADILLEDKAPMNSRRWWSNFRAEVVAECMANGINKTTASVQVGKWMTSEGYHMELLA